MNRRGMKIVPSLRWQRTSFTLKIFKNNLKIKLIAYAIYVVIIMFFVYGDLRTKTLVFLYMRVILPSYRAFLLQYHVST